jgi:hypothetical protein
LLIEILKPIKVFVIIEAKMFASPTQNDLNKQMREQRMAVVDILKQKYPESRVFHIALIPEKLGLKSTPDYTVANWEFLIENDNLDIQDNYFYPYLKFALANYTRLCSKKWGKASTIRLELPGSKIYEDGKAGKTLWVGRWGGRKTVEADVAKGIWKHKLYGTNTEQPKGGQEGNWIKSSEFAEIVDHS